MCGLLPVQRARSVLRGTLRCSRRGGGHATGRPEGGAVAAAAAAALVEGGVGGQGTDRKAGKRPRKKSLQHPVFPGGLPSKY